MANKTGGPGNDTLEGVTGETNVINGNGGNDRLIGGGTLIIDPPTDDTLDGGEGNDTVLGVGGSDVLLGGPGNDEIQGGPGGGGNEDDTLDGGPGADVMIGQDGNDVYFVDNPGDRVAEFSSDPADEVRSTISVALLTLESAAGGDPNVIEILTLLESSDIDGTGNALDNRLNGNAGSNMLDGGEGNDTVDGAAGNDMVDGGSGIDTAVVGVSRANATVTFDGDAVLISSAAGDDRYERIEGFQFLDQTIAAGDLTEDMNAPPIAQDDTFTAQLGELIELDVLMNDSDADGDGLTITMTTGSAAVAGGGTRIAYVAPETPGLDVFTYTISDGEETATADVTVTVNAPPQAMDDEAATSEGIAVLIPVLDNDTDANGDSLTIVNVGATVDGTTQIVGSSIRYTPDPGFTGVEAFPYTVSDGQGGAAVGTVSVTVNADVPVPVLPNAVDDSALPSELDPTMPLGLLANDSAATASAGSSLGIGRLNTGGLFIESFGAPLGGTITPVIDDLTGFTVGARWDPAPGFFGFGGFDYTVDDLLP